MRAERLCLGIQSCWKAQMARSLSRLVTGALELMPGQGRSKPRMTRAIVDFILVEECLVERARVVFATAVARLH